MKTRALVRRYFFRLYRVSMHAKTALIHTLYCKVLRVSTPSLSALGAGTVANLQSNDAARLYDLPQYGHVLWSAPFQILFVFAALQYVIGWQPALAGFGVAVFIVAVNLVVGTYQSLRQESLLVATDARVKTVSEVIAGTPHAALPFSKSN